MKLRTQSGKWQVAGLRSEASARQASDTKTRRARSVISRHLSPVTRHSAFTLIELILIMALLVVITSLAAPAMSNFIRGRALDSEARRLFSLTHAAQSRAVSEGMPMVVWVDEKTGAYGVQDEATGKTGKNVKIAKDTDPKAETLTADSTVQIAVLNVGVLVPTTFNNLPAIRFLPDGSVDENSPQTLQLTDAAGFTRWLLLNKTRTGYEISTTKQ